MTEDEFEKGIGKYTSTSGHKKLMNYVQALFENPDFINEVKKIRKKTGIVEGKDYIPIEKGPIYQREITKLLLKYKLNYMWADKITMFVNYFEKDGASWGTICELQDVPELKADPLMYENEALDDNAFPISLRISPYASQRDLIDYIKKVFNSDIKPLQQKYLDKKVEIGKFRSKKESIKKRNAFILKNKDLPAKQISALVAKEFNEYLDYSHITKIINLSKQK